MKNKLLAIACYSLFLISQSSPAAVVLDTSYWKCTAYDAENRSWVGHSDYQITSINRAFDACKKQSRVPATCKTSKEDCEAIVNGMTTRPMWRCLALDLAAVPWFSNIYENATDAAMAAKSFCQANSALPETCYVYLFTCRNLNVRNF
ncbi:hypothetical protein [Legionella jamestowniensis]|uniref:DUF4189 domain-containing protein n=1 Tax=Legionella jamestowniensis TaxID=455 RepID=A0A0W0UK73_9GAMM|nr:hypothetical protein [Legionella jamestowniensis]KTD08266.1 hypothetical protein Ljam_2461 [Legionella jamestowniensis]OCH98587.1 hypothetical protein A8135_00660 [Legionella jamestowniensis]SFL97642.1 hypothetical protein SAMN02746073_2833 [Legionella jamestowniensis DSM 19215]